GVMAKRCGFSGLEILLMVLFVAMTAVAVGFIAYTVTQLSIVRFKVLFFWQMGYANLDQTAGGIHMRLYSRAFIVDDGSKRVLFVSADIGMVSQRLRLEVLRGLQAKYGDLYRQDNVVLSGTHTHSGLGGYFQYTLFMITSKGYIKSSIQIIVQGIVKSIERAHENLRPGRIFINKGELEESNLNRSPHSYMNNPEEERKRYNGNTDKQVVVLKFTDMDGDGIGMISWFAVHPVSMNSSNHMVSGDNLGYASYLFEQDKNIGSLPGRGPFVATFASSNLGDVSPNTRGPHCLNTGESCDYLNSSYQNVCWPIHFAHQWLNMSDITIQINSTHTAKTCKPALGHSFAGGTIDGGGALNFTQGAVEGDPFWDGIRDAILGPPSNETQDCHRPKPILFSTGEMNWPLPWHPVIVDVQLITIGSVAIVAIPGEVTTMSGRRIREAVKKELESSHAFANTEVVIAGLCNIYTHYITTYEEYQIQRYEAASTIYGPHTLSAYIQSYRGLARAIAEGTEAELPKGPEPPFFTDSQLFSLLPLNPVDKTPDNSSFGEVLEQVDPVYTVGQVASVTFVAGNPRNSGDMTDKTFVTVEKLHNSTQTWSVVHTDASWETRFHWIKGTSGLSNATVEWHIPQSAQSGFYRIRHFGHYKEFRNLKPVFTAYEGVSDVFKVNKRIYY
uniref:Neutral ceramidase n=1 Tax=Denticeps clupeoides TaxID=299321 RepID=A0AAY4D6R4_9TELE